MTDEVVLICLAALKEDREPRARASAAGSLGTIAYMYREPRVDRRRVIIESLAAAGRDESPIVRRAAVRAMIGANAVSVDPGPWLEDSDRLVRLAAAEAIFWLDPANKGRIVPMLRAMIVEADPARPAEVRRPMGLMLRVDRSACRALVPTFAAWLRHEDEGVRHTSHAWLGGAGAPGARGDPRAGGDAGPRPARRSDPARPSRSSPSTRPRATAPRPASWPCSGMPPSPPPSESRALGPLSPMIHHTGSPPTSATRP